MGGMQRVVLCPGCGGCPEVVLDAPHDEVRIGEQDNLVRLRKAEWNELVEKIRQGELRAI